MMSRMKSERVGSAGSVLATARTVPTAGRCPTQLVASRSPGNRSPETGRQRPAIANPGPYSVRPVRIEVQLNLRSRQLGERRHQPFGGEKLADVGTDKRIARIERLHRLQTSSRFADPPLAPH